MTALTKYRHHARVQAVANRVYGPKGAPLKTLNNLPEHMINNWLNCPKRGTNPMKARRVTAARWAKKAKRNPEILALLQSERRMQ